MREDESFMRNKKTGHRCARFSGSTVSQDSRQERHFLFRGYAVSGELSKKSAVYTKTKNVSG